MIEISVVLKSKFHKVVINSTTYNICLKKHQIIKKNNLKALLNFINKNGLKANSIISFCLNNFCFFSILIWNKKLCFSCSGSNNDLIL